MKKTLLAICAVVSLCVARPVHASSTNAAATPEAKAPAAVVPRPVQGQASAVSAGGAVAGVSYAQREQSAGQNIANFKGGDGAGIYIGGSTLAVVLLIVLIVILL